jgi:DNA-binding Lrp family transcriptional regulator
MSTAQAGTNVPRAHFARTGWSMLRTVTLDAIDWKILGELQADGALTNVELARRVGLTPPPCLRRVHALQEAGYIEGYRAILDAPRLGYSVVCFAFVHLASQAESDLAAFQANAGRSPATSIS